MAPSASPLWPASVTALFASGWPANHWPVCAPTVPMALLNPDTVQSASADAVGSATVVAANPPSTPAARTPAIPRRTVLPDICIPHSYVGTLHGPPTQWVSTHSTDARINRGHRENFAETSRNGLQRDVLVPPAPCGRLGECLGQLAAGVRRVDLLVDDADLDGGIHTAGDPFVLGGKLLVQGLALVFRRSGQLPLVQDADCGLGAHHGDLRIRPREHLRRIERARVHRDVGAAVNLS